MTKDSGECEPYHPTNPVLLHLPRILALLGIYTQKKAAASEGRAVGQSQ